MRTKKNFSTLKNKKNERTLIGLIKSLVKSYLKKKVIEICIAGLLALPAHLAEVKEVHTIKFDAEIHISYSILEYQNGIGQP